MSDEGEKTCPLCAEEMDLTDQQLKPCKCGYEICVWCWHHLMDMAEKDDTEGRCPACRSPYNKEKIVGMAASCERLVAEMSIEKKIKSQKGKNKTSEGRKQLSSVRVIQRNLVYIVGLPLTLADEELLQRKEYFAQYGKVLKVSISRTAAGAIQHFANNTCSVYITYSKEEEAIRCIQSVHGFMLDGKPLRACFGTTKYCHAWLRNVACSNPDCLYLHEIGSQEDSFTKDEIISAYTRSRVQQIMGATNSMQRRSGNVLPAPVDDYCVNGSASSAKPVTKSSTSNSTGSTRISPPNSSSGRSPALPAGASWGTRATSNLPPSGSLPSSNGLFKLKQDTGSGSVTFSTALANSNQTPASHLDLGKKPDHFEDNYGIQEETKLTSESAKQYTAADHLTSESDFPAALSYPNTTTSSKQPSPSAVKDKDKLGNLHHNAAASVNQSSEPGAGSLEATEDDAVEMSKNTCSGISSVIFDGNQELEQHGYTDNVGGTFSPQSVGTSFASENALCLSRTQSDLRLDSEPWEVQATSVDDKDVISFEDQRLKDPELVVDSSYLPKISHSDHPQSSTRGFSPRLNTSLVKDDFQIVDKKVDSISQPNGTLVFNSGYSNNLLSSFDSVSNNERFDSESASFGRNGAADTGEHSIISKMLSLDFDSWNESLTSPQNLAKILGKNDKQAPSLGVSSAWKVQPSNQSRFSFAREEEPMNKAFDTESSINYNNEAFRPNNPHGHELANQHFLDKFVPRNGFSSAPAEEPEGYSSHPHFSSSKLPVSRSQVSAPPGFSTPNRAPPPGFTSHERIEQMAMNSLSGQYFAGHHVFESSSLLRNQYQTPHSGNMVNNGDIEFMDPAILAVGRGSLLDGLNSPGLDLRSNFSPQLSSYENDARLQLLMQKSHTSHHNPRFDIGDTFSSLSDSYRMSPRVMEQSLGSSISPFGQVGLPQSRNGVMSNGHWDGWNEVQGGNNMGMAELLRSDRLGFNKFYGGFEDPKLHMSSPGNIFNRTFGI